LPHLQTSTEAYWTKDFKITKADLEFLYNLFLEEETPIKTPELIQRLIRFRIDSEIKTLEKYRDRGEIFKPESHYELGQELVFPALDFALGKVVDKRPGENPEYGDFAVIAVEFSDKNQRLFASALDIDHKLNHDITEALEEKPPKPESIYQRYKRALTPIVVDTLREDSDTLFIAKRWFLKSLLLEVNIGHLNLAEAVLDISGGGPLRTPEIAEQVGFGQDVNPILQSVSLDYALSQDDRFDEVGPAGRVLWFLKRMEPAEILEPPTLLRYHTIEYNANALTDELISLEEEIDDELSIHELVDEDDLQDEATITLIYPHWRMGTLPLTQKAEHLFPIAYRTPRIRMTMLDGISGEEMQGWVVRDLGFVYGLQAFYTRHELPIGARVTVAPDEDDPTRMIIKAETYRPRSEWIWQAKPNKERLQFEEGQQLVGAGFDALTILGVEDPDALDALFDKYRKVNLAALMTELAGELAQFSPQHHVHARTLYSAVNLLRRCPPGPVFANLRANFVHAGGPYWRLP